MESTEAARQLSDIDRLKARTVSETWKSNPWAIPVLVFATVVFFSSFELESQWQLIIAPIAWTAFIVFWVRWLRSDSRARPRSSWASLDWRIPAFWIVGLAAAYLSTLIGAEVSWILAGLLMAGVIGAGVVAIQRSGGK